eukprot:23408-Rhodomonas_salina.1
MRRVGCGPGRGAEAEGGCEPPAQHEQGAVTSGVRGRAHVRGVCARALAMRSCAPGWMSAGCVCCVFLHACE